MSNNTSLVKIELVWTSCVNAMVYGLQPPRHEIAARIGNKGVTAIDGVIAAILTKLVNEASAN